MIGALHQILTIVAWEALFDHVNCSRVVNPVTANPWGKPSTCAGTYAHTGGTNKGPAYYGEGSPGFYSITLTKAMWNSLNLQHYCLGWVLFPHLSIETATLERLERGIPLICPSHLAGRHSTLSLAVQTETEESPDRAH